MVAKPDFTISSHAGFAEDGAWFIEARVVYRDDLTAGQRDRLLGRARLALVKQIAAEGLRGRALGAIHARVVMDDGTGERTVDLGESEPDLGLTN